MPFFPINIISVCIKLARGHLCFSITCRFFFLPSHCISAALNLSSLNDWSEWEVGLGIRGKRTMRALAVLELPFSPFMRWGGPFAEWDVKKVTADLFWKCFFPPFSFFFFFFFFPDHMTLSSNSSLSSRPRFDSVLFWLSSTSLNFFFPPTILSTPHSLPGPPSPLSTLFP